MSVYNLLVKVTANGDLPPKVLDRLRTVFPSLSRAPLHISPEDHGAVGNGTTDDTAALAAALAATSAAPGSVLRCRPGAVYRVTSYLGKYKLDGCTLDLTGATIRATQSSGDILKLGGTVESTNRVLTADLLEAQRTIRVDTLGLSPGDAVFIGSGERYDPLRTNARHGEMNYIESIVSATEATLKLYPAATYRMSDTAFLRRADMSRGLTITGGTIHAPNANTLRGFALEYCRNARVQNVNFRNVNRVQLQLMNTTESVVDGCSFFSAYHTSQAYGVSVYDATQDVVVSNNMFSEIRHAFATNNDIGATAGGIGNGIPRRCLVIGNTASDSSENTGNGGGGDALDAHSGAEDINFHSNVVDSASGVGITMECRSGSAVNNIITTSTSNGIDANTFSTAPGRWLITGNTVRSGANGTGYGILVRGDTSAMSRVVIADNNVVSPDTPIVCKLTSPGVIKQAAITGNVVERTASNSYGMDIQGVAGVVVNGNHVISASGAGIYLNGCPNSVVSGNHVLVTGQTSDGRARCISIAGDSRGSTVNGNALRYTGTGLGALTGVELLSAVTYTGVWGNTAQGVGTLASLSTGAGNVAANNILVP